MKLKMNSPILIIALIICAANHAYSRPVDDDMDNSIQPNRDSLFEVQDWVKVTKAPPTKIIQTLGSTIEIECEVMGSPAPSIQWVTGHVPLPRLESFESNVVSESSSSAIVRVRSVLVIDHILPNERTFTCVGQSGGKAVYASTTVYPSPEQKSQNLSELLALSTKTSKKPKIVYSHTLHIDVVGTNIVLPCKVIGRPRPEIYWMDGEGVITGENPRFKVLPSGELLISDVKWEDMGAYKCVARNAVGKDSSDTFVYPALKED